jgi:hypothetical protein
MAWISGALRAVVLAIGISAIGGGAALACDNCERHDGNVTYKDGRGDDRVIYRDGSGGERVIDNDGRGDGTRYRDGGPQDRAVYNDGRGDGWRDVDRGGCHEDGCRRTADGCRDNCERHDDCRDNCYRHDDCRDNCGRHYDGCHDGCGHRYGGCHEGCGYARNYSCRSGFYDCRYEDGDEDGRYRERYYDRHPAWSGGGAYGFYGQ